MEPSTTLRPKSAKHNYRNRPPRPGSAARQGIPGTIPKPKSEIIPTPGKSKEPDKSRAESPFRPKSAHPRVKSRRGLHVVDIFNSQNSTYTDITVIANSRDAHVPLNFPDPVKPNQQAKENLRKPSDVKHGGVPLNHMSPDNMKETKTTSNVQVVAHQVTHQAKTITRCYYRPLTPVITNEEEYYANLDPVEYFNDPTVNDIPMYKEKPKTADKPSVQSMQLPKTPKSRERTHYTGKPRPWSESIQEQNKALMSRKKCVNTKNSVYAMFFDERPDRLEVDGKEHLRPLTDDQVITHQIQNGGVVGNSVGIRPSKLKKVDGQKLLGNRANQQRDTKSEKSWIPRYNGLTNNANTFTTYGKIGTNNANTFTSYGKIGTRDVNITQVKATKDKHDKYRYELRPFSEGVNFMAQNEVLRLRAGPDVYSNKNNIDKLLAKHKKRCGNFPNGFDLKPRKNNLVGPEHVQLKQPGAINDRLTPRPRKLKPIQGVHKS